MSDDEVQSIKQTREILENHRQSRTHGPYSSRLHRPRQVGLAWKAKQRPDLALSEARLHRCDLRARPLAPHPRRCPFPLYHW